MTAPPPPEEDPPPLLGSWRNLYLVVLATLGAQILVYWWITRVYG